MKKVILIIVFGLLWCNVGFAECIKGNCTNGQGTYTFASGNKYVGEYKDGKQHGQGTFTWTNGNKYIGEWKDGKQHGQGTLTWSDGTTSYGPFKNDKRHGTHEYTYPDGTKKKILYLMTPLKVH